MMWQVKWINGQGWKLDTSNNSFSFVHYLYQKIIGVKKANLPATV
jgi:hypothetical protein